MIEIGGVSLSDIGLIAFPFLLLIIGVLARRKYHSIGVWVLGTFLLGLVLSLMAGGVLWTFDLAAFIAIVLLAALPVTHGAESKKCPFCAEWVKAEAKVCKHCGKDLPAPAQLT